MTKDEALKLALEWIEAQPEPRMLGALKAITAIKEVLAQSEQGITLDQAIIGVTPHGTYKDWEKKQRTWVGLDAFDRMFIRTNCTTLFQQHYDEKTNTTYIGEKTNWDMLFEAIEAKLKEKNA